MPHRTWRSVIGSARQQRSKWHRRRRPAIQASGGTGKWQSGTLFYKYLADGTGGTWDTIDNVLEEEAQDFTWTLVNADLTHIHILEIGGTVPKVYTVTELTATSLKYNDDFGVNWAFTKVP